MKASEMTNEELAACIESARLAPAKYVREDDLNFHSEAIREAAARLRNLGEIGCAGGREATREKSSQVCNAAKLREACEALMSEIGGYLTDGLEVIWCSISGKTIKKARAALSSPPRNCDRPECVTTKAAQDVWRREDGGKTAYYEWLLAKYTK